MTNRGQRGWRIVVVVCCLLIWGNGQPAHAATTFTSTLAGDRWKQVESAQPNFWGPLETARAPQQEAYQEAPGGMRLVQYFDKVRVEQRDGTAPVTTGLLTIELKTGRVQVGDNAFENRAPAAIGIAGDTGASGPTYADLAQLPERVPDAASTPAGYLYTAQQAGQAGQTGQSFRALSTADEQAFADRFNPPSGPALAYFADPTGRYGQVVYQPFLDFINALPVPIGESTGYPIAPLFIAQVRVGGTPTTLLVQAFERRVLTYNPDNPAPYKVEFGNIGQHYYQWRYGG